jgi:hypothetical protein
MHVLDAFAVGVPVTVGLFMVAAAFLVPGVSAATYWHVGVLWLVVAAVVSRVNSLAAVVRGRTPRGDSFNQRGV